MPLWLGVVNPDMSGWSEMASKARGKKLAQDLDRIIVRLPDGMRERLQALAEANGRSMTAETVAAIEQHLTKPDRLAAVEQFIEKHREMIDGMSAYEWFGKDSVLGDFEKLKDRVDELEMIVRPDPELD